MPEQIRCPSCNATLRVPETLLGKHVKCPKCQKTFLAETEESPDLEVLEEEREPAPARRRPRLSEQTEDEEEEPPPPEEEYEEEEERPRRRKRRRRSGAAESAVAGPAIALMIIGIIGILTAVVLLVLHTLNVNAAGQQTIGFGDPNAQAGYAAGQKIGKATVFVWDTAGILWGILLLVGGLRMKLLQNFGLAMTTSIFALLPCNCCCLLGLPFGIWGLVVLNRPEVKDAFS